MSMALGALGSGGWKHWGVVYECRPSLPLIWMIMPGDTDEPLPLLGPTRMRPGTRAPFGRPPGLPAGQWPGGAPISLGPRCAPRARPGPPGGCLGQPAYWVFPFFLTSSEAPSGGTHGPPAREPGHCRQHSASPLRPARRGGAGARQSARRLAEPEGGAAAAPAPGPGSWIPGVECELSL